jgi:phosphate transport system substrate-binding protein
MLKSVLLALALIMAGGQAMAQDKKSIGGSTTVLPIAQKEAEVYMNKFPQTVISVSGSGSGDGLKALLDGSIDLANSSRGLKPKEVEEATKAGIELIPHVIAFDCIVPVVHLQNPLKAISLEQLKNIYNGSIKNWKELNGQDNPIVVISRDFSSGTFEIWQEKVLGKDRVRADAQMQSSNGGVVKTVANNKYAIGYVGLGYVSDKLKALAVNGVAASAAAAKDGSFPLARELYMFTRNAPNAAVAKFLEFVKGKQGQSIVEAEGFVAAYSAPS